MVSTATLATPLNTPTKKATIVLISVAHKDEDFWGGIHGLAKAAAGDLGVNLEILYSNRNHVLGTQMAQDVAARRNKPDYAIVVGEKLMASRSIPILTAAGIKVFMYGNLTPEELKKIGEPREKYPDYIGKIAIDDYSAGYKTAKHLIDRAGQLNLQDSNGLINLLAFEGVRKTSFSSERMRGLRAAAKEHKNVRILHSIPTDWSYDFAYKTLPLFLNRYKDLKIAGVWCANSDLAAGAADILKETGYLPGEDVLTTGVDWSIPAIKRLVKGDISTIAGGFVAIISWIVTAIHDYHNGYDFNEDIYLNPISLMTQEKSDLFLTNFGHKNWDIVDYKKFSKAENPALKDYTFTFDAIFDQLSRQ